MGTVLIIKKRKEKKVTYYFQLATGEAETMFEFIALCENNWLGCTHSTQKIVLFEFPSTNPLRLEIRGGTLIYLEIIWICNLIPPACAKHEGGDLDTDQPFDIALESGCIDSKHAGHKLHNSLLNGHHN